MHARILNSSWPLAVLAGALLSAGVLMTGCSSDPTPSTTAPSVSATPAPANPSVAWENKLIRRPGAGSEDGKVYVVQNGKKHWVLNAAWMSSHGFKFPGDVHEIPAPDLASIETGDPIQ